MKKVLLVATVFSHICQFHKPLVEMLHEKGVEVHVAGKDNLALKNGLKLDFVDKSFDVPFSRSPFSLKNIKAYKILKKIINEGDYDIVHCNTPVGGILTRLAGKKARKKGTKIFYTAHGFHFFKGAPKKNWLLWYPIEKIMAKRCDKLITITDEDYNLASKKFKTQVVHMHGVGVDENRYHVVSSSEALLMREKEGLKKDDFVIICTGELNKNKNQITLINALNLVKDKIPNIKVLFAGNGPLDGELKAEVERLKLTDYVKFLGYRKDLETIVPSVNLVVSCSKREGLPLNIVEAMLTKKPIVASKNRGHNELVTDGVNGYLFDACDVEGFAKGIENVYNSDTTSFREASLIKAKAYTFSSVKEELKNIYFGE